MISQNSRGFFPANTVHYVQSLTVPSVTSGQHHGIFKYCYLTDLCADNQVKLSRPPFTMSPWRTHFSAKENCRFSINEVNPPACWWDRHSDTTNSSTNSICGKLLFLGRTIAMTGYVVFLFEYSREGKLLVFIGLSLSSRFKLKVSIGL